MKRLALSLAVALAAPGAARAEEPPPLWEAGVGLVGLTVPDYGGSDERQYRVLPFPYFVYRGERVQADRDGLHLLANRHAELDFSFNAEPPVDAGGNLARDGMPSLMPTVEAGPSVNVILLADADKSHALKVRLAGRVVIASDVLHWKRLGVAAAPELAYQWRGARHKVTASMGPVFATEGVHDYAYEVPADYETMDRPAYDAPGGYSGARAFLRGGVRVGPLWLGAFVRYDNLRGAAFASSPLIRNRDAVAFGTAVAWIFARSKRPAADAH